jgi:hypothetical protein
MGTDTTIMMMRAAIPILAMVNLPYFNPEQAFPRPPNRWRWWKCGDRGIT